jgi:predicted nucleic acid-binding protein
LDGPVFITDRGKPAHFLLSIEDYQHLTGKKRSIVEALSMPGLADIKFDPPRTKNLARPADFFVMFLLDTNVISELRKAGDGKANPHVVAWLTSVDAAALYLSAVTLMELEFGILRTERREPLQGSKLRAWMNHHVLPEFSGRILPIDATVARRCAQLHVSDPRPERDAFIAGTALVHGMTMVTRNTADFTPTGVPLLNPWDQPNG